MLTGHCWKATKVYILIVILHLNPEPKDLVQYTIYNI